MRRFVQTFIATRPRLWVLVVCYICGAIAFQVGHWLATK